MKLQSSIFLSLSVLIIITLGFYGLFGGTEIVVVDHDGIPIEGAFVIVDKEVFVTNEDGEVEADGSVMIVAEGFEKYNGEVEDDETTVLVPKPYASVSGYVYDKNGPIDNAVVIALDPNSLKPAGITRTYNGLVSFPGIAESNATFLVFNKGYSVGSASLKVEGDGGKFFVEMSKNGEKLASVKKSIFLTAEASNAGFSVAKNGPSLGLGVARVTYSTPRTITDNERRLYYHNYAISQLEVNDIIDNTPETILDPSSNLILPLGFTEDYYSVLAKDFEESGLATPPFELMPEKNLRLKTHGLLKMVNGALLMATKAFLK